MNATSADFDLNRTEQREKLRWLPEFGSAIRKSHVTVVHTRPREMAGTRECDHYARKSPHQCCFRWRSERANDDSYQPVEALDDRPFVSRQWGVSNRTLQQEGTSPTLVQLYKNETVWKTSGSGRIEQRCCWNSFQKTSKAWWLRCTILSVVHSTI